MKRLGDLQEVNNTNPHCAALKKYSHIRIQFPDGAERSMLFTDKEIQRGLRRANKNQEDIPKVGWLRDILD